MSFYLRKEWVDQEDGIGRVLIHYACVPMGQQPEWGHNTQTREMIVEAGAHRKRRAKVLKLPRSLDGQENYTLCYYFQAQGARAWNSPCYAEEIVADGSYTFVDYAGHYTNICLYWSIDGWGAPNYSTMFEDGTGLDHPLSSLHFYGRAHDGIYVYERFRRLQSLALPHVFRGRAHGPRGARVDFCFHIMRRGSPCGDDCDFWDNNDGLNFWRELR